jgi:hypothetical protein
MCKECERITYSGEFWKTMKNSSDINHNMEQSNNQNYIQEDTKGHLYCTVFKGWARIDLAFALRPLTTIVFNIMAILDLKNVC